MEVSFKCGSCGQELTTDASGAGSEVQCPTCGKSVLIPAPTAEALAAAAAAATAPPPPPPPHDEKHFSVPVHEGPAESLIRKPNKPLEAAAKESDKHLRIKVIRRTECVEVGKDKFEEVVSEFLGSIGDHNFVNISTVNYTQMDMGTRALLTEYGVVITYKG